MNPFHIVLLFILTSCSTLNTGKGKQIESEEQSSCFVTADEIAAIAKQSGHQFLDNKFYDVVFDNAHGQPFLVEYKLVYSKSTHHLERGRDYPGHFVKDERVSLSSSNAAYLRTGWDKGHIAPAEDFSSSVESARETFLYSNVSPQNPSFNRHGSWSKLESKVREIATEQEIQILAGPLEFSGEKTNTSNNSPYIPKYFFKIILSNSAGKCLRSVFILENSSTSDDYCRDNKFDSDERLPSFIQPMLKDISEHNICN